METNQRVGLRAMHIIFQAAENEHEGVDERLSYCIMTMTRLTAATLAAAICHGADEDDILEVVARGLKAMVREALDKPSSSPPWGLS